MVTIKHLMDRAEPGDGKRLWVESIGLTRDLQEWCSVDHVFSHLGPPIALWKWFETHPTGYEHFRGKYHVYLDNSPHRKALAALARATLSENVTLLHQGEDPEHNTATALYEYLVELSARVPEE